MKSLKTCNIVVLMAGEGQRFADEGYTVPKPLIKTRGKTILEWTTSSIPLIKHNTNEPQPYTITFAIRTHHDNNQQLTSFLKRVYGPDTRIVCFDELTAGNLATATIASQGLADDEPLLILDADNRYDGSNLFEFINSVAEPEHAVLCVFEPLDDQEKWCFAKTDSQGKVSAISEKKRIEDGKPMMGVFYYSSKELFAEASDCVEQAGKKVRGEFYMSQTIDALLEMNKPVFAYTSPKVAPLGTPADLKEFENDENLL